MTTSSAQAVLDRMEADQAFTQRIKEAGGAEASLALLGGEGFEVTEQELRDAVLDRYGNALTPEQLDAIAGGISASDLESAEEAAAEAVAGPAEVIVGATALASV